jgi:tRNA/tmRNA/rRNA uracil-C5-methylase (TrmA/RlmC/RlmD family)
MNIKVKIEKAVYEGFGLGFNEGKVVFVPYAVPGDEAEIEIIKERKDHCFGRVISLITPSAERVNPECPNFGICGGCDYLNVAYETELSFKKQILADSLARIGHMPENQLPEIPVVSADRFHYRSHADVKCGNGKFGFYEKDSHTLVPFPDGGCLLLSSPIIDVLSKKTETNLEEFKIACSYNNEWVHQEDDPAIVHETENGIRYDRHVLSFFQANRFLRAKMLDAVRDYAALTPADSFLDIGCGAGFFTLFLARYAKSGEGIDINKTGIKWARHNARLNRCDNLKFAVRQASDIVPGLKRYNVIVVDPPRAGLSKKSREIIVAVNPGRIVYVSCDPATFARDSADFLSSGYSMKKLTLFDMFPGTYHIEIIGLFEI